MTALTHVSAASPLAALTRQEIRNYLTSKLFWGGLALTILAFAQQFFVPDKSGKQTGALWLGLAIAAGIGVFGVGVMTGLVRRSDRLAAAAGASALSERDRSLALAGAVIVPGTAGFVLWVVEWVGFQIQGYEVTNTFDGVPVGYLLAFTFGQGVMASVGGPLLGLVAARYLRFRGMATLLSVSMIVVTILMQGIFPATRSWRMVWVWTQWAGPVGLDGNGFGGEDAWGFLPGSPFFWVLYLAALCALAVLAAVHHDPEANRPAIRRATFAVAAGAAVFAILSIGLGVDSIIVNPIMQ
jgi:hypothetical protein